MKTLTFTGSLNLKKVATAFLFAATLALPMLSDAADNNKNANVPLSAVSVQDVKNESELPRVMRTGKMDNEAVNDLSISSFSIKASGQSGKFNVSFNTENMPKDMYVRIVDEAGYDVFFQTVKGSAGNYNQQIDLSDRPAGVYYFQVTYKGKTFVKKLIFS